MNNFECPRCGHCCQSDVSKDMKHIKTWSERCEEHPDHQTGMISERMIQERMQEEIDELRQALETDGGNCYGDGTVYRGQRNKDSETPTLNLQSMWERAYEQVCEERDAIVKDSDKAYELLRWAETEMRYAKWGTRLNDQHGRTDVYTAIVEFLK